MRNRPAALMMVALSFAGSFACRADDAKEFSVQASATVQSSPAQIAIHWLQDSIATPRSYTIYRRAPGEASWGTGTTLPGTQTTYVDSRVVAGKPYEYQIVKKSPGYTGYGYLYAGINVPPAENRGRLLLVVDQTYAADLVDELARLQQDLIGDGWTVTRIDVGRSDPVARVKDLIKARYDADPANVKAVFLFGHVPVPYAGDIVPDGHYGVHEGAWPCDGYYADMDGTWTDAAVNDAQATDPRNHNVPGDGKFDQSTFPAPLKLMIGRVDLANMPGRLSLGGPTTFPSELELLRNYLNKDHSFRNKLITTPERGIVGDYFGSRDGEAFAASAWRNFAPFFGAANITTPTAKGAWIPTLSRNSYLWAYACGSGSYTSIEGIGNVGKYDDGVTTELVNGNPKAVFTMLYGSWLGDWDSEDNLQRAVLATPGYGLTCVWSGRPHWFLQHMALGEPIGFSTRATQNDGFSGLYQNQRNSCAGWVHIALMGDPTLRMQVVAPISNLRVTKNNGAAILSWSPSSDSVGGYNIYRATSPDGPFTRINTSPVGGTTYTCTETNSPTASSTYMVRAVKLETSGSGTYYNLSEGKFVSPETAIADRASAPGAIAPQAPIHGPASSRDTQGAVDRAGTMNGKLSSSQKLSPTGTAAGAGDTVWFDDTLPAGAVTGTDGGDAWNWVGSNPGPFSGSVAHRSTLSAGFHQHFFDWAYGGLLTVNSGDVLFAYIYIDPNNVPSEVMLDWNDGTWEHRAYWGANKLNFGTDGTASRHYMGPLPAAGQWVRLQVPASQVGLEGSTLKGMAFQLYDGRATWDYAGKSVALVSSGDSSGTTNSSNTYSNNVWFDDSLPAGAVPGADAGDGWNWVSSNPAPFSGSFAHQSSLSSGMHQHYFDWAYGNLLNVGTGDVLYAYVYLDPNNLPSEIMLHWNNGTWEHRAYWGANNLPYGTDGTASRHYMGPLPAPGQWARLEVPATTVGVEGSYVKGMAFTEYDGRATWDYAGKASALSITNSTGGDSSGTNDSSVVGTNSPPVVSTNLTPTTSNTPPAVSLSTSNWFGSTAVDDIALNLPKPGAHALHVLTPTLLELKLINTKDPDPAHVTPWDLVNSSLQFLAPPLNAFAVTANGQSVAVQTVGFKRRPLYAPLVADDLRIDNSLYLQLATPISDNQTIEVKNPDGTLWGTNQQFIATVDPLRYSPAIHVNQEGYLPNNSKKAMVGYFLGSMGELNVIVASGFKIVDANSGATVFQGSLVQRADAGYVYTPTPYQKVYEADFTGFNTPGQYRLVVPGMGASLPFAISDTVAMDFARAYALGLYHQRCGTNNVMPFTRFTHDLCHVAPAAVPTTATAFPFTWTTIANYAQITNPDNPVQTAPKLTSPAAQLFPFVNQGPIDVSGGHHDAGDYSKYTLNSVLLIHYLMFAVDSMPGVAALDNLGIPESGDGISDLMQEAKWEADFLAKMQDTDGGFYFLVYPQTREYENNVTPDHGDPQLVWPKTSSATAASVAALAQCASSPLFKQKYPAAAALYLQKAKLGWQFLMNGIAKYGKNGIYQKITHYGDDFADQDELAWAACEMYLATGEPQYQQALLQWFPDPTNPATFRWGWWRMYLYYGNAVRSYAFAAKSGRLAANQLDANYLAKCVATVTGAGDDLVKWSQQCAYGTSFPEETKHVRGAGWYFSGDQTFDMTVAYQLNPKPEYLTAILANMNYEGGCNPANVAYVTGMGWKRERDAVNQYAANDRHVLPPTGEPIGNVQGGFGYLPNYGGELNALCFPSDNAAVAPYPFYDRWADSWNVSTEFVAFEQARSVATYAFLAAQTQFKTQAWKPVPGQINVPTTTAPVGVPLTVSLQAPGVDLTGARIVWEARDQDPAMGQTFTFAPKNNGTQWVEAEAQLPDGRRVFAIANFNADSANLVWVDDALPAGAAPGAEGGDTWNWVGSNPAPISGSLTHPSINASGLHQHYFDWAAATMTVGTGTVLYAYVYLDPANPPSEVMLEWNDGTWSHNAYWGANSIGYGTDGTPSRRFMGPLPAAGQWVQLKVPASQVNLEGSVVKGMGFALFNGRATWDAAGVLNPNISTNAPGTDPGTTNSNPSAAVSVNATDASRADSLSGAFTITRSGDTSAAATINYSLAGTATSGVDYQLQQSGVTLASLTGGAAVTIPAGAVSATLSVSPTTASNIVGAQTVVLTLSSGTNYSLGAPSSATVTIAGNTVSSSLSFNASSPTLTWAGTTGAVYRIAYKNNLSDPEWMYSPAEITATGGTTSWSDATAANQPHRFYLIIRVQ